MTAVASPNSYNTGFPRNGWTNGTAQLDLKAMTANEVSRMFVRRSNSSSSINSTSSTTTIPANSNSNLTQINGITNGDGSQVRKKPARALWPSTKAEPVSGLSTARSHSVAAAPSGPSAASAISALHTPSQGLSQHAMNAQSQPHTNGFSRFQQSEPSAVLCLLPMNGTFERKTIDVPFHPDILKIGRQTNAKTLPLPGNGYFDSKVLSRQHAEVWADRECKIWIRDIRSSNGTFVNSKRLSLENRDSEPHPLKDQDVLELGIDIVSEDGKTIVHHKVAARVEHAGMYNAGNNGLDNGNNGGSGDLNAGQRWHQDWRNRNGSQGSLASGRPANSYANGTSAAAYHSKWLQPVTMEQVVKRLKVELRDARLQSQNLHHTSDFVDAVLANRQSASPKSFSQKIQSPHRMNDLKSRFAIEPPAPPPSQPLPEKPDAASNRPKAADMPVLQPFLRRSDTEKPLALMTNGNNSPTKSEPSPQISSLREALQTTQRELTATTERLKDMEETLRLEREARNSAEKRADRLNGSPSSSSSSPPGTQADIDDEDANTPKDTVRQMDEAEDASTIHQRFDVMRIEMDSMRAQVEKFRQRAEAAEQNSQKDRQTLAEMIDSIRDRDNAVRRRKEARAAKRGGAHGNGGAAPMQENATAGETSRQAGVESEGCPESNTNDHDEPDLEEDDDEYILNDDGFKTKLNGHASHLPLPPHNHLDGTTIQTLLPPLTNPDPANPSTFADSLKALTPTQLDELDHTIRTVRSALQPSSSADASANALRTTQNEAAKAWGLSAPMTQEQLTQGAPFASMLGVVLLGVGLMAWINGWTPVRPER